MSDNNPVMAQQMKFTGCVEGFLKNEQIIIDGVIAHSFSVFRDSYGVSLQFESAQACFLANEKLSWRYADPVYAPNTLNGTFEKQKGFVIQGCYFTSLSCAE